MAIANGTEGSLEQNATLAAAAVRDFLGGRIRYPTALSDIAYAVERTIEQAGHSGVSMGAAYVIQRDVHGHPVPTG